MRPSWHPIALDRGRGDKEVLAICYPIYKMKGYRILSEKLLGI